MTDVITVNRNINIANIRDRVAFLAGVSKKDIDVIIQDGLVYIKRTYCKVTPMWLELATKVHDWMYQFDEMVEAIAKVLGDY